MSISCFAGCNADKDGSNQLPSGLGSSGNTEQTGGNSSNSNNEGSQDDIYTPWIK